MVVVVVEDDANRPYNQNVLIFFIQNEVHKGQ